ncbi:MAG: nicotinate phosphoribosyltransferase, partial [Pseudomonadota bacterium]|nr:nicotinate phosphoribosyltransferase [Pseudomonadota bacterium]
GRKQVYRRAGADGTFAMDLLTLESAPADGEPLIAPVMRGGERVAPAESLDVIRDRFREQLQHLPPGVKLLKDPAPYPVKVSAALETLAEELDRRPH